MAVMVVNHLAWAAGLFDGEGSVTPMTSGSSISARLCMTDSESVYRFHRIVQVGKIHSFPRRQKHHRPALQWSASGANAIRVMRALSPWLSSVKLADFDYAMRKAPNAGRGAGWRLAEKTVCKYGHDFTPENTIKKKDGTRQCRECKLIYGRALWRRQHPHAA